ncbi:MAG: iron complex transport system permease protein [bacterium P3]|nr:MAG: iron complex transport system permease protein [bacterium P3]KWW40094.1 MAG: iron complex transport system permease protein [bacterium F083]
MKRLLPYLLLALLLLMAASAAMGAVRLSWDELWRSPVFLNLRLPRILLCVLAGAALSVSGASYQAIFRNSLTDPYVLGISSGASLGAAVAIVAGLQHSLLGIGGCALVSALLTIWLIYRIATIGNRLHSTTLLLTGVCLTFLIAALVSLLMVLHQDKMESIIFWTMGSFSGATWGAVLTLLPVVVLGVLVVLRHARDLNLLLVGSEEAQSMGVEVEKVKKRLLLATTLMISFTVSCSGVIGFVGLVVPHCVRLLVGPDNRRVLPYSIVVGGIFVLLCDTLARTVLQPGELPVGSLTALVGAPLFIYLLYRSKQAL